MQSPSGMLATQLDLFTRTSISHQARDYHGAKLRALSQSWITSAHALRKPSEEAQSSMPYVWHPFNHPWARNRISSPRTPGKPMCPEGSRRAYPQRFHYPDHLLLDRTRGYKPDTDTSSSLTSKSAPISATGQKGYCHRRPLDEN